MPLFAPIGGEATPHQLFHRQLVFSRRHGRVDDVGSQLRQPSNAACLTDIESLGGRDRDDGSVLAIVQ